MRTLPLRLSPIDGESLPGYVNRYSHMFSFPPGEVISALGIDGGAGNLAGAGRYGVSLPATRLADAALASGIAEEVLEGMVLSRYAGVVFDHTALAGPLPLAAEAGAHDVLIWRSRFCPRCLREEGAWRLAWQLGLSAVCIRHEALLARVCPKCGLVPQLGPRARWPRDSRGELTDPARCAQRYAGKLCRTRLGSIESISIAENPALLAAQRRIDAVLDGQSRPTLAGVELQPPAYLRDVRALCDLLDRRARLPTPDPSPERLPRRVHTHPAALAAVLPQALQLADLPDQSALADALRELADRRYRADGQTLPISKAGQVSQPLKAALRQALSATVWATASSRMGFHPRAHRRPDDLDRRLQARHVPQLFWAEDYQHEIAELFDFDDFSRWLGRRFCSVLLSRMLKPLDWQAAVRYLDFPERFVNDGYNTTFTKLRANNRFDELARRVKRVAGCHAEEGLVDYKQRRARLSDWNGIDLDCWHLLQPRLRPRSPSQRTDRPVRRRRASLWLWCQLTSGDERAAPLPLRVDNLAHQAEFINTGLPQLRERLAILGELLLRTPTEERATLHGRLAATLHTRGYLAENFDLNAVDPLIASRVLAHASAHTGVDIPSLTAPSVGSQARPAVTHARLLTARLLRRTARLSWKSVAAILRTEANHICDNDRRYQAALNRNPCLAGELEQLHQAITNWETTTPTPPSTPHDERMRSVAVAINTRASELLANSHGPVVARCTSIALCRQHTDLTCPTIAAIHGTTDAQPSYSKDTVARLRRDDPDYAQQYKQLLAESEALQRQAGYTNANLKRGLTGKPRAWAQTREGFNYVSQTQFH